ncbi:MAG: HD domain-containing protein [Phycisphaerales bacterium]|nr:HD domain-containing protein [Phycisphaerales bacterium]
MPSGGVIAPEQWTYLAMDLEAIWKRARADLTLTTLQGGQDVFLWEHTVRVARSAEYICRIPEIQARTPDEVAVTAAALYHDAGWIVRVHAGEIERHEILLGPAPESACSEGARMMERSLKELIPPETLDRAGVAIRARNDRQTEQIEAQIIAEADNLEEFGLMFLWPAIRRGAFDGKGVQSILDTWRRRIEYQFWTARLTDSFRFETTRNLAVARLARLETFMSDLLIQQEVEDLRRAIQAGRKTSIAPAFRSVSTRESAEERGG